MSLEPLDTHTFTAALYRKHMASFDAWLMEKITAANGSRPTLAEVKEHGRTFRKIGDPLEWLEWRGVRIAQWMPPTFDLCDGKMKMTQLRG